LDLCRVISMHELRGCKERKIWKRWAWPLCIQCCRSMVWSGSVWRSRRPPLSIAA